MPGKPSSRRRRTTGSVITPRSSATTASSPSSRSAARNTAAPGPRTPPAVLRGGLLRRHRPVGDEAAEVVDARQVDELERAAKPLDPPPITVRVHRGPVVERVAPQLARLREEVRRHARDRTRLEQVRVGAVVGAVHRDVDRHVPEEAHATLAGVRPQRLPFALEPDLVCDAPAVGDPVLEPVGVSGAEGIGLVLRHARAADRRGCPASPRTPTATCRASRSGPRAARAAGPATMTGPRRQANPRMRMRVRRVPRSATRSDGAGFRKRVRAACVQDDPTTDNLTRCPFPRAPSHVSRSRRSSRCSTAAAMR